MFFILSGCHNIGKSSLWENIKKQEKDWAYVPEFDTIVLEKLNASDEKWEDFVKDIDRYHDFEKRISELTLEAWENNKENSIVVCDKGMIDNYVYSSIYMSLKGMVYFDQLVNITNLKRSNYFTELLQQTSRVVYYETYTFLIRPQFYSHKIEDEVSNLIEQKLVKFGLEYEIVIHKLSDSLENKQQFTNETANYIINRIQGITTA
jgi:hypothetical protein